MLIFLTQQKHALSFKRACFASEVAFHVLSGYYNIESVL